MEGYEGHEGQVDPVNVATRPITLKRRQFYGIIRAGGGQFSRVQRANAAVTGKKGKRKKAKR